MIKNKIHICRAKESPVCPRTKIGVGKPGASKIDNMCNTRILCQTNRTTVSQCMECGMYFIWHNNVLLNFGNKEFYLFLAHIKGYVFHERAIPFPDGEERLIMQSPASEINLAFAEEEWEDLKDLLTESAYLGNVYEILKGK